VDTFTVFTGPLFVFAPPARESPALRSFCLSWRSQKQTDDQQQPLWSTLPCHHESNQRQSVSFVGSEFGNQLCRKIIKEQDPERTQLLLAELRQTLSVESDETRLRLRYAARLLKKKQTAIPKSDPTA